MKSVNISEVFCEILGGVSILVYLIPLIDLLGLANLDESFHFIADNLSASGLAIVVVVAYLLGLLMDAVGLVADEMLFDKLHSEDPPSAANRKAFWKNAPESVIEYRDTQWAYFSAYRNLAIIGIPGGILWVLSIWCNYGVILGLIFFAIALISEYVLLRAARILITHYFNITKTWP